MCCDGFCVFRSGLNGLGRHNLGVLVAGHRALVLRRIVGDLAIIAAKDLGIGGTLLDCSEFGMPCYNALLATPRPLRSGVASSGQGGSYWYEARGWLDCGGGEGARGGLSH